MATTLATRGLTPMTAAAMSSDEAEAEAEQEADQKAGPEADQEAEAEQVEAKAGDEATKAKATNGMRIRSPKAGDAGKTTRSPRGNTARILRDLISEILSTTISSRKRRTNSKAEL